MKNFKDYFLSETDNKVYIYLRDIINGAALCKRFSDKESEKIYAALQKLNDPGIDQFLETVDEDIKYSDVLSIEYLDLSFTLYAANGQFRLGAGGYNSSDCSEVKEKVKFNNFIKSLKKSNVVISEDVVY